MSTALPKITLPAKKPVITMDIGEIMATIPHRQPFLLIDAVTELIPGERVTAVKNVSMNEPYFAGHFPGAPVMPGVLIVEAMAQAGACAILSMEEYRGKTAFFAAIDKAKFRKKVVPGDVLTLKVELTKLKEGAGVGKGVATVNGKKAAEAQLTFVIG